MKINAYYEQNQMMSIHDFHKFKEKVLSQGDYNEVKFKTVRKLYFDNAANVKHRDIYNRDGFCISLNMNQLSDIQVEKKNKMDSMSYESSKQITRLNVENIIAGNVEWLKYQDSGILNELYWQIAINKFRPSRIFEYKQEEYYCDRLQGIVIADTSIQVGNDIRHLFDVNMLSDEKVSNQSVYLVYKQELLLPHVVSNILNMEKRQVAIA